MGLNPGQTAAVRGLVQRAPDALLMRLTAALSAARITDPVFAPVADIAKAESEDRRMRDLILEPLAALAHAEASPPRQVILSARELGAIWRTARLVAPKMCDAAGLAVSQTRPEDPPPVILDTLCLTLAEAFETPTRENGLEGWSEDSLQRVTRLLQLSPILRVVQRKVDAWTRTMTGEAAACIRLAFKDATAKSEDVTPLFMEALLTYLAEPVHVLRLVAAVTDRASDRFLAGSELAGVGERLIVCLEEGVKRVKAFNPTSGKSGGVAAAGEVAAANLIIKEFEKWVALAREGPWGGRIHAHKIALVQAVETHYRAAEGAVGLALPLHAQKAPGAAAFRPAPRVDGYPDEAVVRRAEGYLSFIEETRTSASTGGFGALRAKVIEAVVVRLDAYVADLVERLHANEVEEPDWARAHLDVAADFFGLLKGPKAAQIVRRRAAAA